MKYLLTILFVCISLLAHSQSTAIQESMQNYDYEKVTQLISKEETDVNLLFIKAQALKGLGKYPEAIAELGSIIQQNPSHLRAFIELAECNRINGKYKDAIQYYEKAQELSPENKFLLNQRATLFCNTEQFTQARNIYSTLLKNDSSSYNLRMFGICLEGSGKSDSASIYYKKAIGKQPLDNLSIGRLSSILIDQKKYDDAILYTEQYRHADTTNWSINRQNAMAHCLNGQYKEAINRYNSLVNQGDTSYITNYYLGISYFADEYFYEAHDYLEKALKQSPSNINLLYYLGKACSKTSWKNEGIAYIDKAINLTIPADSTLAKLYKALADGYSKAGLHRQQIETLKTVYKYEPSYKYALYSIALIYDIQLKDTGNAIKYLEEFLKTKPRDEQKKESTQQINGEIALGPLSYYQAAEKRLEAIKEELFFKEGIKHK